MQFDLCGSGLTGTMGVFQDTDGLVGGLAVHTPGRLTTRCADGGSAPAIVFDLNAAAGTYYIDVAGIDNGSGPSQGSVHLNWQPSTAGG